MTKYDLIVIGAGTSGFPSAKIAATLGKKVLLIGEGALGGKCIKNGCIPAKFMIYATKLYRLALKASKFGIKIKKIKPEYSLLLEYTNELVNNAIQDNENQLKDFKNIDYIKKNGQCISDLSIDVDEEQYEADHILISTGTKPWIPPIYGIDEVDYLTHETIFNLQRLPNSIAFVGGGFISLEFANVFNSFGSKVYIIDTNSRPIFAADETISELIKKYYEEDGITFLSNSRTSTVSPVGDKIMMETNKGDKIKVEEMMISTGFRANTEGLNLGKAGVKTDERGNIIVNNYLQTTNPEIYAIGDILGKSQFTHMALRESKLVINNIFSRKKIPISFEDIPYAVFTDPPIGSVGKTEQELKSLGINYEVVSTEFPRSSRANLMKLKRGFVKLLYKEDEILGCHMLGESADILIHEIVPLINLPRGLSLFRKIIHAHPTLSEIFRNLQEQIGII